MRYLLSGFAVAFTVAIVGPVRAQAPLLASAPVTYSDPYGYRLNALTPDDAYRQGLINRWELERLVGPTPQALQGPSPDGGRGFEPGN